jgi:glucosamine-6-phosphate deaminase
MSRDFVADALTVRVFDDVQSLAVAAASDAAAAIRGAVDDRGDANIMLATGNSQLVFLAALIEHTDVDWSRVTAFHMDEYVDLPSSHPASFQRYMREKVASTIAVKEFHYLAGDTGDAQAEAERYAALLRAHPLDLCVCGIGENGHLAFNDPPVADFDDPVAVKIVELDEACRRQQVADGCFATLADVPRTALTLTVPRLLAADRLIGVVPGPRKREAVRRALTDPIGTACPATALRTHPDCTLFLDADAAAGLPR